VRDSEDKEWAITMMHRVSTRHAGRLEIPYRPGGSSGGRLVGGGVGENRSLVTLINLSDCVAVERKGGWVSKAVPLKPW